MVLRLGDEAVDQITIVCGDWLVRNVVVSVIAVPSAGRWGC